MSRLGALASGSIIACATAYIGITHIADRDVTGALMVLAFGGLLALACFGLMPQPRPRKPFRYLNHLVMTRAERPPIDSWVHVAPTHALRPALVLAFSWAALGFLALAVYSGLMAFGAIPPASAGVSRSGLIVGTCVFAVLGIATGWIAGLAIGRSLRNGSVGTRPSGVTLGAATVSVRVPGRDVEIPWAGISSVRAEVTPLGRREHVAVIRLDLAGDLAERVQLLPAEGYAVPSDALYTALRWYHARPETRWELGRVEGQRRLDAWCADAVAAYGEAPNVS